MAQAKSGDSRGQDPNFVLDVGDDGKWVLLVRKTDGSKRPATPAECAEQERRFQAEMRLKGEQIRDGFARVVSDPNFVPAPTFRYLEYVAWKQGRAPGYRPTMADLLMLAAENAREVYGSQDPRSGSQGAAAYESAQWFALNTNVPTSRLRHAASPKRKTKRVRSKDIDGVVCYSVADVQRWWSGDMRKPCKMRAAP